VVEAVSGRLLSARPVVAGRRPYDVGVGRGLAVGVVAMLLAALGPAAASPPPPPLAVSVVGVDVGAFGATVRWSTSRPANVVAAWGSGEELALWSPPTTSARTGGGRSALTALEPATTYRVRLVARAGTGQATAEATFRTPALPAWIGATTTPLSLVVGGQPFFPRMVWKQCPWAYPRSLGAGINVFMGTGCGSVTAQLHGLAGRALSVLGVDERDLGGGHVVGYHQLDEADEHVDRAESLPLLPSSRSSRRVTFLTLTNHFFSGAAALPSGRAIYPGLIARAEMVGFDLYPLQLWCRRGTLHTVFEAQRELVALAPGKPTYQWIEAAPMNQCFGLDPSPALVRAETWLAIAGGARGIGFFPSEWRPDVEAEIARLGRQIGSLSAALLGPEATVSVMPSESPVRAGARRLNGATYVIAVNSWTDRATARLRVDGLREGPLAVLGEHRTVQVRDGVLVDSFRGLGVHAYVAPPAFQPFP
jgi:hypothetical protein